MERHRRHRARPAGHLDRPQRPRGLGLHHPRHGSTGPLRRGDRSGQSQALPLEGRLGGDDRRARVHLGERTAAARRGRPVVHAARAGAPREHRPQPRLRVEVGGRRTRRRRLSRLAERDAGEEPRRVPAALPKAWYLPSHSLVYADVDGNYRLLRRGAHAAAQELGRADAGAGQGRAVRVGRLRAVRAAAVQPERPARVLQQLEQRRRAEDRPRLQDSARLRVQRAVPLRAGVRGAEPGEDLRAGRHGEAAAGRHVAAGARTRAAASPACAGVRAARPTTTTAPGGVARSAGSPRHAGRQRGPVRRHAVARHRPTAGVEPRARQDLHRRDDLRVLVPAAAAAGVCAAGARGAAGHLPRLRSRAGSSPG